MKRVRNYGKDNVVVQTPEAADPSRVRPEDLKVTNGGVFHKKEGDLPGYSPFRNRGLETHNRPLKSELRDSHSTAQPPRPQSAPNPAADVEVIPAKRQIVGSAVSQPAFKQQGAKQDVGGTLDIDATDCNPNDFVIGHSVVEPGGQRKK